MTGAVRTREMAVYRWVFFSLLLIGVALTLFGITMLILFDTSRSNEISRGVIYMGLGWFCSGSLGLITTHIMQRGRFVRVMRGCGILVVVLSGLWLTYFTLLIEYRNAYRLLNFLSPLTFFSVATTMVVIAAYLLSLKTQSQEIRSGARFVSCLLLICTVISLAIIGFEDLIQLDFLVIGMAIGWVVTILGIVGISLAVRRENKPRGGLVRTIPKRVKMKMTCPQCRQWLEAHSGPARCDNCGLRLIVEIKEPRCPCGYLLYELQGKVCPECGREIEQHAP